MTKWQQFSKDYLSFSKKERIGVFAIVLVIVIITIYSQIASSPTSSIILADTAILASLDTLESKDQVLNNDDWNGQSSFKQTSQTTEIKPGKLFNFDPNTLLLSGWLELGLKEKTANTILHYREKGGHFYKPEDLQKIWGLPKGFYERVKEHIVIASDKKAATFTTTTKPNMERSWNIDINIADTTTLIELPGIGSKLAARILNFRNKLGGFYTIDQVGETYGLPDSTFQKIKSYLHNSSPVRKININTATKDELKLHPYIRWNLANAIVEYRNQHGNFKDVNELRNIMMIDEKTLQKIIPYLSL
jgi:competence protein ComEA